MADVSRPRSNRIVDANGNGILEWMDFFEQIEEDNRLQKLKPYTVEQLNTLAASGNISGYPMVICTNAAGGATACFWNGANWLKVYDNNIVS